MTKRVPTEAIKNNSIEDSVFLSSIEVVEGVNLVASSFQFFTRLGSVFAEEVGGFGMFALDGPI